jgi:DNA invertase Pin-like site-specific DNA recombinase
MQTGSNVATAPDTRRPAVYLRVSTDRQELDRQQRQRELARQDFPETEPLIFEDEGVSAYHNSITDRPGGAALCEVVAAGQVAAVYADAQDRLSRGDEAEWIGFRDLCRAAGTRLIIDGRELRDDLGGKLEGYLKALLARQESDEKAHRSRSAALGRRQRGYWTAGPAPTGYDSNPHPDGSGHRTLTPNADARKMVEGFEAVALGESINGTATRLGMKRRTFHKALTKPVYAGFTVGSDGARHEGSWRAATELVEGIVAGVLIQTAWSLDRFLEGDAWRNLTASREDAERLAHDVEETAQQIERLIGLAALGGRAAETAKEKLVTLNEQHAELDEKHQQATRDAETLRADLEQLRDALRFGGAYDEPDDPDDGLPYHVLTFWTTASVESRRETLSAIFSKVELGADFLAFTFRHGFSSRIVVDFVTHRKSRDARSLRELGFGPRSLKAGDGAETPSPEGVQLGRNGTVRVNRDTAHECVPKGD